jgi:hypothetical protein
MSRHRKFMALVVAAVAVAVLGSAASASASRWNPQGGPIGPFTGTITFNDSIGDSYACVLSGYVTTSGAIATTSDASGTAAGPTWTSCSNNWPSGFTACMSSSSAWTLDAVGGVAAVLESGINFVLKVGSSCASPVCTETVSGAGNDSNYDNSTQQLTEDPALTFPVTGTGFCFGRITGTLTGAVRFPNTVSIS